MTPVTTLLPGDLIDLSLWPAPEYRGFRRVAPDYRAPTASGYVPLVDDTGHRLDYGLFYGPPYSECWRVVPSDGIPDLP